MFRDTSLLGNMGARRNGKESTASLMNKHQPSYGLAQLEKNKALIEMSRQGNTSLLMAAEPNYSSNRMEMSGMQDGHGTNQKNRISFMLANNQHGGDNKKHQKASAGGLGGQQQRLGQALELDSDEDEILNMDIGDQNQNQMEDNDDMQNQFTYVRRSQRLSTVYRDKSEISATPDVFNQVVSGNISKRNAKAGSQEKVQAHQYNQAVDQMYSSPSLISMMKRKSNEPIKFVKKKSARFGGPEPDPLKQQRNVSDFLLNTNTPQREQRQVSQIPVPLKKPTPQKISAFSNFKNTLPAPPVQPEKQELLGKEKVKAVVQQALQNSKKGQKGADSSVAHGKQAQVEIDSDSDEQFLNDNKKRRGRKRERDDLYFDKAVSKIQEIRDKLKNAKTMGMTVKERQRLRNQISAQQSRIRKKEEVIFLNKITRVKDDKFTQLIDAMVQTLHPKDLIEIHKNLAQNWEISEMSYKNYEMQSYKRQRNSMGDSNAESRNMGGFPRLTRTQSKNMMTRMNSISKESDMIPGNPMTTDSHYHGSMKDNQSQSGELAVRQHFSDSLINAFVTRQEEFDQFQQNDEKQYEDDDL